MKVLFLLPLILSVAFPVLAQEEEAAPASSDALFFIDLGPGFFTSLDDSSEDGTARSGVMTYVGAGAYLGNKVALSGRLNFTQEDTKSVITSLWGWLTYTFGSTGPGPYISAGAGTQFNGSVKFAGRGGWQIGLFSDDALAFIEAEGRYVNEEEVTSAAIGNVGMRFNWGHR